jgi:hypothetical protein
MASAADLDAMIHVVYVTGACMCSICTRGLRWKDGDLKVDEEKKKKQKTDNDNKSSDEERRYRVLETWMRVQLAKCTPTYDEFKQYITQVLGHKFEGQIADDAEKIYAGFINPEDGTRPEFRFSAFYKDGIRFGSNYIEESPRGLLAYYRPVARNARVQASYSGDVCNGLELSVSMPGWSDGPSDSFVAVVDDRFMGIFYTEKEAIDWIVSTVKQYEPVPALVEYTNKVD